MPTIQGPITFKQGKELPDKFKESVKENKVNHLPFKEGKEVPKPKKKAAKSKTTKKKGAKK